MIKFLAHTQKKTHTSRAFIKNKAFPGKLTVNIDDRIGGVIAVLVERHAGVNSGVVPSQHAVHHEGTALHYRFAVARPVEGRLGVGAGRAHDPGRNFALLDGDGRVGEGRVFRGVCKEGGRG